MSKTVPDQEMASTDEQDPRIAKIAKAIRVIPDFPKPGTNLLSFENRNGRFQAERSIFAVFMLIWALRVMGLVWC